MTDTHQTNSPGMPQGLEDQKRVEGAEAANTANLDKEIIAPEKEDVKFSTKEEILERLRTLSEKVEEASRTDISSLKQAFYKLHHAEQELAKKAHADAGGTKEDFKPAPDQREEELKNLLNVIKDRRKAQQEEDDKEKEMNLKIRLSIIEELKELIESPEDPNKKYTEFKKIQQQWNDTKNVPAGKNNELWKNYQIQVEKFYDQLKLNQEFREYDFKKNLEIKTHLCEAAEKLADEPDVVSAFHQLQKLHQEFRETGPVSKELRSEIWARFKAASTAVNRRHQQHFEALKEEEQNNLDKKTVICEIIEATDYDSLTNFALWDEKTQEIIALQAKWKTIGFAPQKSNVKIFERFRKSCDDFFAKKTAFFKAQKSRMAENLAKKRELCEKAESLKDSTDWKETANELTKIQREWKEIGPVAKKHSDAIWKRFITACDYFFEQKNKANASQRAVEEENLTKKKAIIEELDKITSIKEEESEEVADRVKKLMQQWSEIGFVPFKEKDKIYKQYHSRIDKIFAQFHLNEAAKKISNFKSSIRTMKEGAPETIYKEREKIVRIIDNIKNELLTYENNMGFLNASSKKGNSLVENISKKADKLKQDMEVMKEKLRLLDQTIKTKDE